MASRSLTVLRRDAADGDHDAAVELFRRTHPMTLTEAVHSVFPTGECPQLAFDVLHDAWTLHMEAMNAHRT